MGSKQLAGVLFNPTLYTIIIYRHANNKPVLIDTSFSSTTAGIEFGNAFSSTSYPYTAYVEGGTLRVIDIFS